MKTVALCLTVAFQCFGACSSTTTSQRGVTAYLDSPLPTPAEEPGEARGSGNESEIQGTENQIALLDKRLDELGREISAVDYRPLFFCYTGLEATLTQMFSRREELEAMDPDSDELLKINQMLEEFEKDMKMAEVKQNQIEVLQSVIDAAEQRRKGLIEELEELRAERVGAQNR